MVQIKLTYFPIQGPAEPIRLALVLSGVAFEDVRVSRDEMLAMREAGKLTPPGCAGSQLPMLEVDGKVLLQSMAQLVYCGKLGGLYPADPWEAAKCDEAVQFIVQDIRGRGIEPTMFMSDEAAKTKARAELQDTKLPEKFALLDKMLEATGYLVGSSLTVADLHLYCLLNWIGMGTLDGVSPDTVLKFPKLTEFVKKMNEMEKIKAWNAEKNPKLPWC